MPKLKLIPTVFFYLCWLTTQAQVTTDSLKNQLQYTFYQYRLIYPDEALEAGIVGAFTLHLTCLQTVKSWTCDKTLFSDTARKRQLMKVLTCYKRNGQDNTMENARKSKTLKYWSTSDWNKRKKTCTQQPLILMLATVRQSVSVSFCTVCAGRKDGSF